MNADTVLLLGISRGHSHCVTEDQIDEWWRSLPVERKVELFVEDLEDQRGTVPVRRSSEFASFQQYSDQFLADMERLQKSPLAGLVPNHGKAVRDAAL